MKLKLNPEYINATFICPFTNKVVTAILIDKKMWQHYYNKGIKFIFIEEKEKKSKK